MNALTSTQEIVGRSSGTETGPTFGREESFVN